MSGEPPPEKVLTFDADIVAQLVRVGRVAQGLPERIADASVLAKLAVLVKTR